MAEQWAISARANSDWQRPEEQKATQIIQQLLDHQINPQEAAQLLSSTYETRIRGGDAGLWFLWNVFFHAIHLLGHHTENLERLAQMLRNISMLPDLRDNSGQPIRSQKGSDGQVFWSDVPNFAFTFREAAVPVILLEDFDHGRGSHESLNIEAQKLLRGSIFGALYLRKLDPDGPPQDLVSMRKQALWSLMDALEVATESPGQIRRTEIYVPPAARWILIAGLNLYEYCRSNLDYEGETVNQRWIGGPEYGSQCLFTGRDGFSVERWAFWKRRFEDIRGLQRVIDGVKNLAAEAAEMMAEIEGKKV
ncbi:hypothetical protein BDR22DRAFT_839698 [Usnea florida]